LGMLWELRLVPLSGTLWELRLLVPLLGTLWESGWGVV